MTGQNRNEAKKTLISLYEKKGIKYNKREIEIMSLSQLRRKIKKLRNTEIEKKGASDYESGMG